ncbi:MAG TPA: MOSC domain-containing protein [Chloroflexia bacterium]
MTVQPSNTARGRVLSVNVGKPREIEWLGQRATTSIWKSPVVGRVPLRGVNLKGDDQADRRVHGGRDKAVYCYGREDEEWWEQQLGRSLEPGTFGENLTLTGVDVNAAVIGERWEIGTALLEVAQPRFPCWKLGARMGDPDFPPRFGAALRPGVYLRILIEGDIGAGDEVRSVFAPAHNVTVGDVAYIYHKDHARASLLLEVPELPETLKAWARRVQRHAPA